VISDAANVFTSTHSHKIRNRKSQRPNQLPVDKIKSCYSTFFPCSRSSVTLYLMGCTD